MGAIKAVGFIIILKLDSLYYSIKHFFESKLFQKKINLEMEKRHKENEEYFQRYLEAVEQAKKIDQKE